MPQSSKKLSIIVTVQDDHVDDLQQVAQECRAAGMNVHESLDFLGQLTGEIETEKKESLQKVRGVLSVEESRGFQLPPADSEVQ